MRSIASLTAAWSRNPRVLRIVLGAYVMLLAVVGFFPSPVDRPIDSALSRIIQWCEQHGLGFITYTRVEFGANIVLFIPLGMLLGLLFGTRRWWLAPVICFVATVLIELGQGVLLPQRVASPGDVIANTIGGFLGTLAAVAIMAGVARNRRAIGS